MDNQLGKEEKSHFEVMEELGQLSIFDLVEIEEKEINKKSLWEKQILGTPVFKEDTIEDNREIYIGSKVKINKDEIEADDMLFFEHYQPDALENIGVVEGIKNGLFEVRFKKTLTILKKKEIILIKENTENE